MTRDRALGTVVGLLAGLLGVVASGQVWYRTTGHGFTGAELTDRASQALPLAAMAGIAVTLLLGRWGRRLAGALVVALGVGLVAVASTSHVPTAAQLRQTIGAESVAGNSTSAHWASVAAGLLIALAGLVFVVRAGRWPVPTSRFERGRSASDRPVASSLDAWKAMDAGADPTEPEPPAASTGTTSNAIGGNLTGEGPDRPS